MNPDFIYISASHTNIMERFLATGWMPPSRRIKPTAEQRLRALRADIYLLARFSDDGETVTMDAFELEEAIARAEGFTACRQAEA